MIAKFHSAPGHSMETTLTISLPPPQSVRSARGEQKKREREEEREREREREREIVRERAREKDREMREIERERVAKVRPPYPLSLAAELTACPVAFRENRLLQGQVSMSLFEKLRLPTTVPSG